MRKPGTFLRNERGSTLVETTIVFTLMMLLTFGLVDFGYAFWQYSAAEKATAAGARWIATRHGVAGTQAALTNELYTSVVPDCFTNDAATTLGTLCSQVAGASGWAANCAGAGGGSCSSTQMTALLTEMRRYFPNLTAANVAVHFQGSSLGFVGRGRAIPLITVRTSGLTYNFVAIGALLGLNAMPMPSFDSTLPAEDQKEGPGI
jgi:Flp pilus assembly protein TadG